LTLFVADAFLPETWRPVRLSATTAVRAAADVGQLWQEPQDLASRDLFVGPASDVPAPTAKTPFTFVRADRTGYSPGYDLRDPDGRIWDVKLGREAQTEVVASRILWAIGYHQVPTYYLSSWTMTGGPEGHPGPGRFRPELSDWKATGDWSWYENEFVGTQPFNGLIVANLILNNWDWKTSNNKIYEMTGAAGQPVRRYIVRDLGASLGKTAYPQLFKWAGIRGLGQGSRNDLEGFERQGFIKAVAGDRVEFDYNGINGALVKTVQKRDVVWTCELLSQISDAQWNDAFRAAGYPQDQAARYVAKLKAKVAEGLALANATPSASSPPSGGN
jgi:hypothetical protein